MKSFLVFLIFFIGIPVFADVSTPIISLLDTIVRFEKNNQYFCYGKLVTNNKIITARHCFDGKDVSTITVIWQNKRFKINTVKFPSKYYAFPAGDLAEVSIKNDNLYVFSDMVTLNDGYYSAVNFGKMQLVPISLERSLDGRFDGIETFHLSTDMPIFKQGTSGTPIFKVKDNKANFHAIINGIIVGITDGKNFAAHRAYWKPTKNDSSHYDRFEDICKLKFQDTKQWMIFQEILNVMVDNLRPTKEESFKIYNDCNYAKYTWDSYKRNHSITINGANNYEAADILFMADIPSLRFVSLTHKNAKTLKHFKSLKNLELEGIEDGLDLNFLQGFQKLESLKISHGDSLKVKNFRWIKNMNQIEFINLHFSNIPNVKEFELLRSKLKCPVWRVRFGQNLDEYLNCKKDTV